MNLLQRITAQLGMDKAIAYTSLGRMLQAVGGVISIVLVSTCLSGVEQGFYFTFSSILAIQVFFELGFTGIITQFVAHEKAHLSEHNNTLDGEENHRSRLAYLLRFCLKWYSILAGGLFVVILAVGIVFFTRFYDAAEPVLWQGPWILLVLGTTVNFLIAPISAFIEGLGKVKEIAFLRLIQQLTQMVLLYTGLIMGLKLYASAYVAIVGAAIFVVYAWRKFGSLLCGIYLSRVRTKVSYRSEIFPYQWRVAVSWLGGYFSMQIFNPVLFATEGAVVAGQMGMTLAGLNAIQGFGLSWVSTKIPIMSEMIARREYRSLDTLFGRTLRQTMVVVIVGLICFWGVVFGMRHWHIVIAGQAIGERFLPYLPMVLMSLTIVSNQYLFSAAAYLRCHKQDPFLVQAFVNAVLCTLSTLLLGKYFGLMGIAAGYAVLTVIACGWGHLIYVSKKREWHL